jgi:hypothetical protein
VARFERPVLRLWSHPPAESATPLHIDASWPSDARAGKNGVLHLAARDALHRDRMLEVRVPLPPGVTLAEAVTGARVVQGVLAIRRAVVGTEGTTIIDVPIRFALAGSLTAPEIHARIVSEEGPRGVAPARPFVVR